MGADSIKAVGGCVVLVYGEVDGRARAENL